MKTLQHEEPDRVLVHMRGVLPNGTYRQWFNRNYDGDGYFLPEFGDFTVEHESIGQDTVFAGIPTLIGTPSVILDEKDPNGFDIHVSVASGHMKVHSMHGGLGYSWYIDGYFKTPDIRKQLLEENGIDQLFGNEKYMPGEREYEAFKRKLKAMEKLDYEKAVIGQSGSLFENTFEGLGASGLAHWMRKYPSELDKLLDEMTGNILHAHKLMLEAGAYVVGIADDLGQKDRGLVSPKNYARFYKPRLKKICDQAHKYGAFTWMHSCGFIENFLPHLIEAGLDAIQSLEPAAGVSIDRVKENFGDKMTFVGGMDSTRILSFGTVDEVIADAKHYLEVGMPGGGYIAGPSHRIIDCPPENVQALKDTIQKYGKYR
ncbi:MAG: uroporphyrinogen decarboxylase family protein [Candidatus Hodarchaeota archaeon]